MRERIIDINPKCEVKGFKLFYLPKNSNTFDFSQYDYVIDAVDTVSAKIEIIRKAKEANVPVISCMGTGNKLNPLEFKIADISKTSVCPLARVMRKELSKRGIQNVKCLYSTEKPVNSGAQENGKPIPASISYVPSVAGLVIAGEVIRDLSINERRF
jgi:tRNA A37 threonylcarbamoyladenosine dehydratase